MANPRDTSTEPDAFGRNSNSCRLYRSRHRQPADCPTDLAREQECTIISPDIWPENSFLLDGLAGRTVHCLDARQLRSSSEIGCRLNHINSSVAHLLNH